jgi:hypothetical protein
MRFCDLRSIAYYFINSFKENEALCPQYWKRSLHLVLVRLSTALSFDPTPAPT